MAQKNKKKRPVFDRDQRLDDLERKSIAKKYQTADVVKPLLPDLSARVVNAVPSEITPVSKPQRVAKPVSLLLTVADLCDLLKVSRSTITRMERAGSIPGRVMLGGSVRYHREIIENWLREGAV
jgi:excisionase family DNA binding protein